MTFFVRLDNNEQRELGERKREMLNVPVCVTMSIVDDTQNAEIWRSTADLFFIFLKISSFLGSKFENQDTGTGQHYLAARRTLVQKLGNAVPVRIRMNQTAGEPSDPSF